MISPEKKVYLVYICSLISNIELFELTVWILIGDIWTTAIKKCAILLSLNEPVRALKVRDLIRRLLEVNSYRDVSKSHLFVRPSTMKALTQEIRLVERCLF